MFIATILFIPWMGWKTFKQQS